MQVLYFTPVFVIVYVTLNPAVEGMSKDRLGGNKMFYAVFIIGQFLFTGVVLYHIGRLWQAYKKGRQVDVRVLSCEQMRPVTKSDECYYEVTVDFYGMKGEEIKKTLTSGIPYEVGSVIRSRYLDKKDLLCLDSETYTKKVFQISCISAFGITAITLALVTVLWWLIKSSGQHEIADSYETSGIAGEPDKMITLTCHYTDLNAEIFSYSIDIYDDLGGMLLLFPNSMVEGRYIEQQIPFYVSENDGKRLADWAEDYPDTLPAVAKWDNTKEAMIYVTVYADGENIQGSGCLDEALYAEIYGMFQDAVPESAWRELQERETVYYGN